MLKSASSIDTFGTPSWELTLCLLFVWISAGSCIIFGISSVRRVIYVTALAPYVILFIIIIRGATLPGAGKGIEFYLKPNFEKLKDAKVWLAAGEQVFFSLNLGYGINIMYSSFNKFSNNIFRF